MRVPNRELEVILPALAREAREYPSPAADAALERMLRFALERELHTAIRAVRAILETETGAVAPAVRAEVSPEG